MTSLQPLSDTERGLNILKSQRKTKVFEPLSLQGTGMERGFSIRRIHVNFRVDMDDNNRDPYR